MAFTKCLVLFLSFVASASALTTPHAARIPHHRAIAARIVDPAPVVTPIVSPTSLRTRQNTKRCKPRNSSAVLSSTAQDQVTTSSITPEHSPSPKPLVVSTSSKDVVTPKPSPPPAKPTSVQLAPSHTPPPPPPPPPPPHTTTNKPAPSPTKASPAPAPGSPSFLIGTQTGQGTFYSTGLGACGITNKDSDHIAAVSHLLFDTFPGYNGVNPNSNPLCNRQVTATYQGKSVKVSLTDRCTGCAITDLDFSPAAFNSIADPAVGRISGMTWNWD